MKIKIKRGAEANLPQLDVGEPALTTDQGNLYMGTPSGNKVVGSVNMMSKTTYDTTNNGKVDVAEVAESVQWSGVANKPSTFTPSSHNHDDTYYTESEINTQMSGKLGVSANAVSASKLATARTISLSGDVSGSVSFDGSGNVSITTAVANDSHTHSSYIHDQIVPSATWTITHNLNSRPSITVVDTGGNVVYGDYIYTNSNSITLTFSGEFAGKAYLN